MTNFQGLILIKKLKSISFMQESTKIIKIITYWFSQWNDQNKEIKTFKKLFNIWYKIKSGKDFFDRNKKS